MLMKAFWLAVLGRLEYDQSTGGSEPPRLSAGVPRRPLPTSGEGEIALPWPDSEYTDEPSAEVNKT
jgi:hypothetical protein